MAAVNKRVSYTLELDEEEYALTRAGWMLLWEQNRTPKVGDLLGIPSEMRTAPAPLLAAIASSEDPLPPPSAPVPKKVAPVDIMDQRRAEAERIAQWGATVDLPNGMP